MKRTMVKKRLADGRTCDKCIQAEEMLKKRGLLDQIDDFVWAIEGEPESPGMQLAQTHDIEVAPFFIVEDGETKVYTSALRFIREQFPNAKAAAKATPTQTNKAIVPASLTDIAQEYENKPPQETIRWGLERFGDQCAIAFSGAEDVVLIDMAAKSGLPFSVFCLDTGRLHPETYRFVDKVRKHYGITIHMMSPQADALQAFVAEKGLFSFYEDGHKECCGVRKIEPLRRALRGYDAWITGQRKDQSPATRGDLFAIHDDEAFQGKDGRLVKLNPLANWSSQQVWGYIRANDVPYNELHERGFISIGCEPCTRATRPGEHERAGRWWWEDATKRECGLHVKES